MAYSISPSGAIFLCSVPLENDYLNTITFSSHEAQQQYFQSKVEFSFTDYLYVKKDNTIKVDRNIDDLLTCNYLFYRNYGYGGTLEKTYYCFITNKRYINENTTELTIETDVFQTWQIELIWKPCFVNREHVNNDSIGANTIDENLDTGDYIINNYDIAQELSNTDNLVYILETTKNLKVDDDGNVSIDEEQPDAGGSIIGGVPSGYTSYIFYYKSKKLSNLLGEFARKGFSDSIGSIYVTNALLVGLQQVGYYEGKKIDYLSNKSSNQYLFTLNLGENNLDGYIPKNNKLLTYPYRYYSLSNNGGSTSIYRYEYLSEEDRNNKTLSFDCFSYLIPGGSTIAVPRRYMRNGYNPDYGLPLGKFPIGSYANNIFYNWLQQQYWNRTSNQLFSTMKYGSDIVLNYLGIHSESDIGKRTTNFMNNTINFAQNIYDDYGNVKQHELVPYQVEGQANNTTGVWCSSEGITYKLTHYTIKYDIAKSIDDYFTMFGYKVNRLKKPNIYGRKNWNYVKTEGCNVECNEAPTEDIDKLRRIFDKGITLWHTSDVGNYNLDNSIV